MTIESKIKKFRAVLEQMNIDDPELLESVKIGFDKCYAIQQPLTEGIGDTIQMMIKKFVPDSYDKIVQVIKKAKESGKTIEDLVSDAKNIDVDKAKDALNKAKALLGASEDKSGDDAVFESITDVLVENASTAKVKNFLLAFLTSAFMASDYTENVNSSDSDPQSSEKENDSNDEKEKSSSDDEDTLANKMIADMLKQKADENPDDEKVKTALSIARNKMKDAGFKFD